MLLAASSSSYGLSSWIRRLISKAAMRVGGMPSGWVLLDWIRVSRSVVLTYPAIFSQGMSLVASWKAHWSLSH